MEGERCGITFYIPKTGGIMAAMLFPHDFYVFSTLVDIIHHWTLV